MPWPEQIGSSVAAFAAGLLRQDNESGPWTLNAERALELKAHLDSLDNAALTRGIRELSNFALWLKHEQNSPKVCAALLDIARAAISSMKPEDPGTSPCTTTPSS